MTISVIIPALNEENRIEHTLATILEQQGPVEIIVVDGGSSDRTTELAEKHATVLTSAPGRALQMNAGAHHASGDVFFFLHADSSLSPGTLERIRLTLEDPAVEAGAFRLRFDRSSPTLWFYSKCTHLKMPSICFGDRGLFVRRQVFTALDGFCTMPLFEDLDLARRLHQRGGFRFMPQYITTAARRFEQHGSFRQQFLNLYLWIHFITGRDLDKLSHLYSYDTDQKR